MLKNTLVSDNNEGSSTILTLLCRDLEKSVPRLDLNEISYWLSNYQESIQCHLLDGLCHQPQNLEVWLERFPASRLVLGICSMDYSEVELQAQARKAGLDPLGVQVVDLKSSCPSDAAPGVANNWAKVILGAALARARAFPGSRPENMKAVLLSGQQKVSRRTLFTLPPVTYRSVPSMDLSRCRAKEGCQQCVSVCPHEALERDGHKILVRREECQSCGRCVTDCPERAVEHPGWSMEELEAQITALLESHPRSENGAVDFVCRNVTLPVGQQRLPIRVPCVSAVSTSQILMSLAHGATSVSLHSCGATCSTGLGTEVMGQVDYCRELLRALGDTEADDRVQLIFAEDGVSPEPAPNLSPLPGYSPQDPLRLFGRGVAARAVRALADRFKATELVMEHPRSPLGLVEIDAGTCTGCETCVSECPTGALFSERFNQNLDIKFDPCLCSACGKCVNVCPEKDNDAIKVNQTTDLESLSLGISRLFRDEEASCRRCGAPVAPRAMLERIAVLLGDEYVPELMQKLCVDCRAIG